MTTPYLICIAAPRACGKDTLFRHLSALDPRFRQWAFAAALKHDLAPLIREQFGWDVWTSDPAQKEIIRPILIAYGCAHRAVDIDHWVNRVADGIKDTWARGETVIPCITDLRFVSELECLRREFDRVVVVNLTREGAPEPTDEEKRHSHLVAAMADHHIRWGNDDEAGQRAHAQRLLDWLGAEVEQGKLAA